MKGDKIMSTNKITCSFTVDRDIYNAYKSIVVKGGENVKGNLIRYMLNVINYETANADTISAIKEVEELKKKPDLLHEYGPHHIFQKHCTEPQKKRS